MKKITPAILGFITFIFGLLFLALPALAENWVETTVTGGDQTFYDADSAYVDVATGLVVVELVGWAVEYDDWLYSIHAFDCSRWETYILGALDATGWVYDYYGDMGVSSIAHPATSEGQAAQWACNNYNSHRSGNIPFDFNFSNY